VKNLPFKITGEELYELFGKFGAIRQIRLGTTKDTHGTAFVVYEDIYEAKKACEHLSVTILKRGEKKKKKPFFLHKQGFNVGNRYIVVLYYNKAKMDEKKSAQERKQDLEMLKKHYGLEQEKATN
jgi:pre-mRNA branch site protein p14